ncbi:MAG: hypothetical protein RR515_05055, partial [Clostridium sp.]
MIKFKLKNKRIRLYKLIMVYIISILLIYLISVCLILFIRFNNSDSEKFNSITRQEALDRGMSIINYTWNYTRVDSSEGVILPYYLKGDGKYIGIPYCYGGQFSLDYSNVNGVSSFGEAVKSAYVPGNINTSQGYVKNSAGMDCSGFVNSVFNIREKTSTTNMDKYFKEIDLNRIKSMDILNSKGNHVYIYLGKVEDGGVMILESTSNGSKKYKDKTVVNYKTKEQFQKDIDSRGYKVMRYKGIKGSTVQDIFDRYEFNNEERYAKSIDCN